MFKNVSKELKMLGILIGIIILSSFFASLVQNSFGKVDVSKVQFETENGTLSGYLFVPDGVDEDNPVPAIVTTHGYLNNSEMQEITAIEMSRRGYVVLAFDMYDHGDATWHGDSTPFGFYVPAVSDAAKYMYEQDYVLKDADGNGMIAVSGHSMGGFSSEVAIIFDEMEYAVTGVRRIAAALPVGSDYRYVPFPEPTTYIGPRSVGMIAAHYDQFFFDTTSDPALGTVIYKDYAADPEGLLFLGQTTAEAGVFYDVEGGQRVIYTPDETHPQNTWSRETGKNTIEFYGKAFDFQLEKAGLGSLSDYGIDTEKTSQVWMFKEAFTFISLIALFVSIFPLFSILSELPVFAFAKREDEEQVFELSKVHKIHKVVLMVIAVFLNFYLLTRFMDRAPSLDNMVTVVNILMIIALVGIIAVWGIYFFYKKEEKCQKQALRITLISVAILIVSFGYRYLMMKRGEIIMTDHYFSAPSINTIVFWAMASGGMILLISLLASIYFNFNMEDKNPFGVKVSPNGFLGAVVNSIAITSVLLLIVALIGWIFKTDFRIYTYAIQIFNSRQFAAGLRYIPFFFIYYFAASISIHMNTRNIDGWKGDLLAAFLLAGPIVLFLIYQYATLYNSGTAAYPTFSLSGILTVGLVPTLSVSGIVMRRFTRKTGNIWTSVFVTTTFFTLITLANTIVYTLPKA